MLGYYVSEKYEWQLEFYEDSLTGGTTDSREVLKTSRSRKLEQEWDFVIALTDLPIFNNEKAVVAEVFKNADAAYISLPGLGFAPKYKRIREASLQLMNEMHYGSSERERQEAEEYIQSQEEDYEELRNKNPKKLLGNRLLELFSPITRELPEDDADIDVRFTVKSQGSSQIRIVSGMVYANRPWELFPAFAKIVIIAFTTGSYALVFPTLWQLSTTYSAGRGVLVAIASILALVTWIILSHGLWERKEEQNHEYLRKLYNATTFFTLLMTVVMYYGILFIMFTLTTLILIPPEQVTSNISSEATFGNYLYVSWLGASIATIIGAIGSALENKEVILNSTYGYRQQKRHEAIQEQREKADDPQA
ncbi:hypothetical protein [Salinicoccus albus]|uniref:hypothetical protein n=1 Tax=Salinicoccus albus TaxID=418756 RepID=UPI0003750E76|nr:hypothetical protein [Salinicoccus albus]